MFTGLVACIGNVESVDRGQDGMRVQIAWPLPALELGESVSVSGVCLTVATLAPRAFGADLTRETLERSTLQRLAPGASVNLERAATLGDRLGGHLVSGHVDGIARVLRVAAVGDARALELEIPATLARFVAEKGSVTLDGVSLTVNHVRGTRFEVMLIPHTLAVTTLGGLASGSELNFEVDLVARYVARWLEAERDERGVPETVAAMQRRGVG